MPRTASSPKRSPRTTKARAKPSREASSTPPAEAATELLPAPVSDEVIEEVVTTLNSWQRETGFAFARQAGRLLLEKFYGGDVSGWRDRGSKDASFRKLASRADDGSLQLSASALYRCVALVELEERLGVSTWKHLTVSHVRAVFGLPDADQKRLLQNAETKEWTVPQLEERAAQVRKDKSDGRGRPRLPAFVKSIGKLKRMLDEKDELFGDLEDVDSLDEAEARALHETLSGMMRQCKLLQERLAPRVPGLG